MKIERCTESMTVLLVAFLVQLDTGGIRVSSADGRWPRASDRQLLDVSGSARNSNKQELPYYFQAERLMSRELAHQSDGGGKTNDSSKGAATARRRIKVVAIVTPPFMMKAQAPSDDAGAKVGIGAADDDDGIDADGAGGKRRADRRPADEWHGYCMDFFRELLKYLPYELDYEIYEAPDGKFGSKTREIIMDPKNNKSQPIRREHWNGMVGELAAGRAQLALAPMSVMAERELVVDFTVPFYDLVGIQILLKRPEVPRDWFKFLTVLDNEVWLSITVAYFVTSLIIYLFDRLSPYSHKNLKRIERIRARRRQRLAARSQRQAPADRPGPSATPAAGGGRLFVAERPLSKQHETLVAPAPSGLVYPLMQGNGAGPDWYGLRSATASADKAPPVGGGRRRLSQDYLQTLGMARSPAAAAKAKAAANNNNRRDDNDDQLDSGSDSDSDSDQDNDGVPDFNLRDSLWFCITSLTPQGGGEAPQNLSGRVVAGAWWLFCFIVIASYTANLAAFLTVSRLDIPIESLDDLAKQYRIKYAPIEGTAEQSFFERMAHIEEIFYNIWKEMSLNDSLSEEERSKFAVWDYPISDKYTKIWAQIQEVQMPVSLEQAIERVKSSTLDDGFALLANANIIRYATMTDCSFRAVGEEFSRKPIALALQKGQDRLRDDLSYAILQLINKRYMEVLREKWWTNNPGRLVCDLNDESEGISIENIGGVFIIILAGVLLSFLVWTIERLLYKTKVDVSRGLLNMATSATTSSEPSGYKSTSDKRDTRTSSP
jgi:hypothetical protein